MKGETNPFSPEAILRASGRRMRAGSIKQADFAQQGPRPSDFGDHEPIPEEAVVQLPLSGEDVDERELESEAPVSFAEEKG